MQDKLKPCAHCGAEAQIYYTGFNENDKRYVECSNCDCPVNDTWSYRTDEAAINAWNTRSADSINQALVDALEEIDALASRAYDEYKKDLGLDKMLGVLPMPVPPEGLSKIYEIGKIVKAALLLAGGESE